MADSQLTVTDDDYRARDEQLRALAAIHGDIAADESLLDGLDDHGQQLAA